MDDTFQSSESSSEEKRVGIHITSDPDRTEVEEPETFGAREQSSMPFRILLVSDLVPQASDPDDWSAESHVHRVDKNNFSTFMEEMAPRLEVEVLNAISDAPKKLEATLEFGELDAFRPERMARQIPVLDQLLDVRELVQAVGDGDIGLDAFRERLETIGVDVDWSEEMYRMLTETEDAATSAEPSSTSSRQSDAPSSEEKGESLDRLLGMVDAEESADAADTNEPGEADSFTSNGDVGSSQFVDALMGAVSGEDASAEAEPSAVRQVLRGMEATLAEQMEYVLEHPEVRAIEAAWRGLKFLVDRLNFRENIQLMVLPVNRENLHEAMHYQVILPEHSADRAEPPLSLILLDLDFGHGHRDIGQLTDLAKTGESLQTPLVAAVNADFFGVNKISGLAKLPALRPHLQGEEYAEWKALRKAEASQFLALALPFFLLRYPYGPNRPVETFNLAEADGLWGNGALAVGVAAAKSFADTGWPTHLTDYAVEDLPIQSGRGGHSPLSALLPGSKQSELARAGFVVLGAKPNHDAVRIVHAPMVRQPETYDNPSATAEARVHASLPCRLFVARTAHRLLLLQNEIEFDGDLEVVQDQVAVAICSFLNVEPDEGEDRHVTVEHVTNVDLPEHELLAVRVRPPSTALRQDVRLVMGLQVEKTVPPAEDG